MRSLHAMLVVLVILAALWAVPAQAGEKKNITDTITTCPIVGKIVFGDLVRGFDTADPRQPLPPVPEGAELRFRVRPVVTDPTKVVEVWVQLGFDQPSEYTVSGRGACPEISYRPRVGEGAAIAVWVRYAKAYRSESDLAFGFGGRSQETDARLAAYHPLLVISNQEWSAARERLNAKRVTNQATIDEIVAQNTARRSRNAQTEARYNSEISAWEAACAAATPRTERKVTGSRTVVRTAVIRFLQNGRLANWDGPFAVTSNGHEVARGQALGGQASFGWWEEGSEVAVRYGRNLELSTSSFVLGDDGIIEIPWRSSSTRPDAPRKAINQSDVLSLLASGRRAGVDGVLRALSTSAAEVESAIRAGSAEVRPVCPGENFLLASGQPAQTASWSPASEQPAVWVTLNDGRAFALQIVRDCGNFVAGRYCPTPELLQPNVSTEDVYQEVAVPVDKPQKPASPVYEEEVPCPEPAYEYLAPEVQEIAGPVVLGSRQAGVRAQPLDLDLIVWRLLSARSSSQTLSQTVTVNCPGCGCKPGEDHNPNCPTGGGEGPAAPPAVGGVPKAPGTPSYKERGDGYGSGQKNAPPADEDRIEGTDFRPGS